MEKKAKTELITIIDEQNKSLLKYKSRLHDIVESYKHLVKEKEALETSIKTLTDVGSIAQDSATEENSTAAVDDSSAGIANSEKVNEDCLLKLKSSLGALTVEKARVENELRIDRKKILIQKEELERNLVESENKWTAEREKYDSHIQELKKKVSNQQREREKEQQDHALMLKELQNLLAIERAAKEKLEEQVTELQHKINSKLPEKKALDYEKSIEELQNKLKVAQSRWQGAETLSKNHLMMLKKLQEEMDDMKMQYQKKMDEEGKRAEGAEDKLKLLTLVKEKRIASLEGRISELSEMVGSYDKSKQQDLLSIQRLKEKVNQLQVDHCSLNKVTGDNKYWDYPSNLADHQNLQKLHPKNVTEQDSENGLNASGNGNISLVDNVHVHCQGEILQLKEELEMLKSKAESALKEKYSKTSAALLSDAKAGKEIKELRSRLTQLQDQLAGCRSQLKLNEEYHGRITANLEKSIEELRMAHGREAAQARAGHQARLLELERQIQKQRERTLALLEEKDREIATLKSTFLSSVIKKEKLPVPSSSPEHSTESTDAAEAAATLLSNSLISSQKDGQHILHYAQELARKDVEISNLRHSRVQTDSALRRLQQASLLAEERHARESESLRSRISLLESGKDRDGTNVEYLKNVVLRFLKCSDPGSQRHMVNAIATVLHFTNSEIQEVKSYLRA